MKSRSSSRATPSRDDAEFTFRGNSAALMECNANEVLLSGPAGCVAPETRIYNPATGKAMAIAEMEAKGIAPTVLTLFGHAQAEVPFRKGIARLYDVRLISGRRCLVTEDHRMMTPAGWRFVGQLASGDLLLAGVPAPLASDSSACRSGWRPDARHWTQTAPGCRDRCCSGCRPCGERLRWGEGSGQEPLPSQVCACVPGCGDPVEDGWENRRERIPTCPGVLLPSMRGCSVLPDGTVSGECCACEGTPTPWNWSFRPGEQSPRQTRHRQPTGERNPYGDSMPPDAFQTAERRSGGANPAPDRDSAQRLRQQLWCPGFADTLPSQDQAAPALRACIPLPWLSPFKSHYTARWDRVQSIRFVRTDAYYDLHVPGHEHYLAEGIWHHNTGKSLACLAKLHGICERVPGIRALIVRKTRESLTESGLVTFEERILGMRHPILASGGQRRMRQAYRYPNGSQIVIGGMDKPGKIMSTEYDLCWAQEAIELHEQDWDAITTRLRNNRLPYQQLLADTNPDAPTHWLKRRCDSGKCVLLESRHEDNPSLHDGRDWTPAGKAYLERLDALTGPRKLRLRHGRWVQAEGVVYEGWDRQIHLVDRFPIPLDWPRYWTVDFGFTCPFVCQMYAKDHDGRLYRYREIYRTKTLVEDHAKRMLAMLHEEAEEIGRLAGHTAERILQRIRPQIIICDHDAEDRATLTRHLGMATMPAWKEVRPGIQAVQARLRVQGDGKPRLLLLRDSLADRDAALDEARRPTCAEDEFDAYVFNDKATKDEPVKDHDHAMDAMRYMVAQFDCARGGSVVATGNASSIPNPPAPSAKDRDPGFRWSDPEMGKGRRRLFGG